MEEQILSAIEDSVPPPSGWYRITCPYCDDAGRSAKRKMSVNADTGYYMCWRLECGAKGFVRLSESHLARRPKPDEKTKESDGTVPLPDEFVPLAPSKASGSLSLRPYINYLHSRGVTDQIIEETGIGACLFGKYRWQVIVPVTSGGVVVGFTARSVATKFYSNPAGFQRAKFLLNEDALLEHTDDPIAIVEGPYDFLRHWPNTCACFGKPTEHHLKKIANANRPVIWSLDADAQSEGHALALMFEFEGKDHRFLKLPPATDPGKTPADIFFRMMLSAVRASTTFPDVWRAAT